MIDNSINNYYNLVNNGINAILFDEENHYPGIEDRITSWSNLIEKFDEEEKIRK